MHTYSTVCGSRFEEQSSKLKYNAQPLFNGSLYAPTNRGLLEIAPDTGAIRWQSEAGVNSDAGAAGMHSISPPGGCGRPGVFRGRLSGLGGKNRE
jgi:hypothetical protein